MSASTRAAMCTPMPPMSSPRRSISPACIPARHDKPNRLKLRRAVLTLRSGSLGLQAVEPGEDPVARGVHLAASKPSQLRPDDGVVRVEQRMPVTVTHLRSARASSPRCRFHRLGLSWADASRASGRFAHMFDQLVDAATGSRAPAAVGAWARVKNAACAQRLSAMADEVDAPCSPRRRLR